MPDESDEFDPPRPTGALSQFEEIQRQLAQLNQSMTSLTSAMSQLTSTMSSFFSLFSYLAVSSHPQPQELTLNYTSVGRGRYGVSDDPRDAGTIMSDDFMGTLIHEVLQLRMRSQPEIIEIMRDRLQSIQEDLAELHYVVCACTADTGNLRSGALDAYQQISEHFELFRPGESATITLLGLVDFFLEQVGRIALIDDSVRAAWFAQANIIHKKI